MRIPVQLKVAAVTIVVVGGVSHTMLPSSQEKTQPAKAQQAYEREYSQSRRRELEELRLRADREGQAISADKLRPGEVRPKHDETAAKAMRSLLRRRP